MNQLESAHRSVRRFFAEALAAAGEGGAPYKVRLEDEQVKDADRPQAVVLPIADADLASPPRVSVPQGDYQLRQSFAATAYPEVDGSSRATRMRANEIADLLMTCVLCGMVDDDGESVAYPGSIALFDYTGVPVEGAGRSDALTVEQVGVMDVLACTGRPIPDPVDDRRWTAIVTLRLSWWAAGRVAPEAPLVDRLIPSSVEM